MKSVLISIKPQYCELIAAGKKIVEVRKTRPRLETPFKTYIYQSKHPWICRLLKKMHLNDLADKLTYWRGKVIGEFVCDEITPFDVPYPAFQSEMDKDISKDSCLTYWQLHKYAYHDKLYAWHISDLVIYDEPKELSEFHRPCIVCDDTEQCRLYHTYDMGARCFHSINRPPQSWCYVEELYDSKR